MAEPVEARFGSSDGLCFYVRWLDPLPQGTADEASRAVLRVMVEGSDVWQRGDGSGEPGFEWSMVELLEWFGRVWPYLTLEESDPLGLCVRPDRLRDEAGRRWRESPRARRIEEQRELLAFEDCHDLGRAFQGMWVPSVWMLPQGRTCWVVSGEKEAWLDRAAAFDVVTSFGNFLAGRLADLPDARAETAVEGWRGREASSSVDSLCVAVGLSPDRLGAISGEGSAVAFLEWSGEPNELVAVARMAGGALAGPALGALLDRARTLGRGVTSTIERWSAEVPPRGGTGLPHEQGLALARWFRSDVLHLSDERRVDPERVLRDAGVLVDDVPLGTPALDAVSVWGARRGPAVLLNPDGLHGRGNGRRATLAHEICHLLVDREGALPFAEVLGGRVNAEIESRARAFAAELLLPQAVAGDAFATLEPEIALKRLTATYRVSREIVAWQARNSDRGVTPVARDALLRCVGDRGRF